MAVFLLLFLVNTELVVTSPSAFVVQGGGIVFDGIYEEILFPRLHYKQIHTGIFFFD